jgi:uncharacterized membrane protein
MSKRLTVAALVAGALFFLVTGIWAFAAPRSFFDAVGHYPPYNRHLFHDIGVFSTGIGAALALALTRRSAAFVALAGAAVGASLHALAHWIDRDLGGKVTDAPFLTVFAVLLIAGAVASRRSRA